MDHRAGKRKGLSRPGPFSLKAWLRARGPAGSQAPGSPLVMVALAVLTQGISGLDFALALTLH